jgi:glycosyltransferase involved in cell wall biosynthesis
VRIALIADTYAPLRTSGAVQLRDLAGELSRQGHDVAVVVPAVDLPRPWVLELRDGVQILRVRAMSTKDTGYFRRVIGETLLSWFMLRGLRQSPLQAVHWDGVVWYSPTIFLGPMIAALKRASGCRSYLILRDVFPEWAVDMGLLRRGLVYRFFKLVERYQYAAADTIGVQSPSNLAYLAKWQEGPGRHLEVLENWLAAAPNVGCSVSIAHTCLESRKILVYAGNMGVAQGVEFVLDVAERLLERKDVGFLFVGRGSDVPRLRKIATERGLDNVLFHDEVEPSEVPGLLAQCDVGLVVLDPRHKTHNVPGKFLTYLQAGLPVLARVNAGNDLANLIEKEDVGRVYIGDSAQAFQILAEELCDDKVGRSEMRRRARYLAGARYSAHTAATQIVGALSGANSERGSRVRLMGS